MQDETLIRVKVSKKLTADLDKLSKKYQRQRGALIREALENYVLDMQWKNLQERLSKRRNDSGLKNEAGVEAIVDAVRSHRG